MTSGMSAGSVNGAELRTPTVAASDCLGRLGGRQAVSGLKLEAM